MKRKPPKARRTKQRRILPNERITSLDQLSPMPLETKVAGEALTFDKSRKHFGSDNVQIGGSHYKCADPAQQHWNMVVAHGWDYFTAQVTKYLFRWPYKGNVDDLKKARHFLDKLIELVENGWLPDWKASDRWNPEAPGKPYVKQD